MALEGSFGKLSYDQGMLSSAFLHNPNISDHDRSQQAIMTIGSMDET